MSKKLNDIFKTKNPVIGALHLMPLLGFEGFSDLDSVLYNALCDLKALEKGGVDGVIVENNYDIPHQIFVGSETVAAMTYLAMKVVESTKLPVGISVLWNDYKAALSIAKVVGGKFVRIPAFVDDVITNYGEVSAVDKESLAYRKRIKAENILIFADIQVKHAQMVDKDKTFSQSVREAVSSRADAIIVTGKWTGDAPNVADLKVARENASNTPIIIGSGVDGNNIGSLIFYTDGVIVGTSFKGGEKQDSSVEVNIKSYDHRIDVAKVLSLTKKISHCLSNEANIK